MIVFIVDCKRGNGYLSRCLYNTSKLKSCSEITLIGENIPLSFTFKINFIKFINVNNNLENYSSKFLDVYKKNIN